MEGEQPRARSRFPSSAVPLIVSLGFGFFGCCCKTDNRHLIRPPDNRREEVCGGTGALPRVFH